MAKKKLTPERKLQIKVEEILKMEHWGFKDLYNEAKTGSDYVKMNSILQFINNLQKIKGV